MIDVFTEASELLDDDATQLSLPDADAHRLGLQPPLTYRQALQHVATTADRRLARDLVKSVLALRNDPRVQGTELALASA